jgi:hypothetical protein
MVDEIMVVALNIKTGKEITTPIKIQTAYHLIEKLPISIKFGFNLAKKLIIVYFSFHNFIV